MGILVPTTYFSASKVNQGHSASFPAVPLDWRQAADSCWPAVGVRARSLCSAPGSWAVHQMVSEASGLAKCFGKESLKEARHSVFRGEFLGLGKFLTTSDNRIMEF